MDRGWNNKYFPFSFIIGYFDEKLINLLNYYTNYCTYKKFIKFTH